MIAVTSCADTTSTQSAPSGIRFDFDLAEHATNGRTLHTIFGPSQAGRKPITCEVLPTGCAESQIRMPMRSSAGEALSRHGTSARADRRHWSTSEDPLRHGRAADPTSEEMIRALCPLPIVVPLRGSSARSSRHWRVSLQPGSMSPPTKRQPPRQPTNPPDLAQAVHEEDY